VIKPQAKSEGGLYTLALGYQPMDGATPAPRKYQDFSAGPRRRQFDTKAELNGTPKHLVETSAKSLGTGIPGFSLLFPPANPRRTPAGFHGEKTIGSSKQAQKSTGGW